MTRKPFGKPGVLDPATFKSSNPAVQAMFDCFESDAFKEGFRKTLEAEKAQGVVFRRELVAQINQLDGPPSPELADFQSRFINYQLEGDGGYQYVIACRKRLGTYSEEGDW